MKPLLPSLRDKKRYLAFEAISKKEMDTNRIFKEFSGRFRDLYGSIALSKSGLRLLPEFSKKHKGLIRINRKNVDQLRAAMCLTSAIDGFEVILRTITVSGSIDTAAKKMEE